MKKMALIVALVVALVIPTFVLADGYHQAPGQYYNNKTYTETEIYPADGSQSAGGIQGFAQNIVIDGISTYDASYKNIFDRDGRRDIFILDKGSESSFNWGGMSIGSLAFQGMAMQQSGSGMSQAYGQDLTLTGGGLSLQMTQYGVQNSVGGSYTETRTRTDSKNILPERRDRR